MRTTTGLGTLAQLEEIRQQAIEVKRSGTGKVHSVADLSSRFWAAICTTHAAQCLPPARRSTMWLSRQTKEVQIKFWREYFKDIRFAIEYARCLPGFGDGKDPIVIQGEMPTIKRSASSVLAKILGVGKFSIFLQDDWREIQTSCSNPRFVCLSTIDGKLLFVSLGKSEAYALRNAKRRSKKQPVSGAIVFSIYPIAMVQEQNFDTPWHSLATSAKEARS